MAGKISTIEIDKLDDCEFNVTVRGEGSTTEHRVGLEDEYYQKLTQGYITKMELIRLSFRFLLARESSESILSRFSLDDIQRYFPEYEEEISV